MGHSNLSAKVVLTAAVSAVFSAGVAQAASDVWSGNVNGDYSNTGNWVGGTPPGNTTSGATLIDVGGEPRDLVGERLQLGVAVRERR